MTDATELLSLRLSMGHLDRLSATGQHLSAHGWIFDPGHTFQCIEVYIDGKLAGPAQPVSRPDVEAALAWAHGAKPAGFGVEIALGSVVPRRLDVVGHIALASPVRLSCLIPGTEDARLPHPPRDLALRVSKVHGPAFDAQGLKIFTDLADQMAKIGASPAGRLLDWGCGCGRVARYIPARMPQMQLIGCDIDAEAIEWCRQNLRGEFIRVDPAPPTPLPDGAVDVVIACSVLTHLSAADQAAWLREIRRILSPGGWFLASTNADFMFQMALHRPRGKFRSAWKKLLGFGAAKGGPTGFTDSRRDRTLDGIAPPGYYRRVYQSREHTIAMCSKEFEVFDYVECGLNGHQDLVILRRLA